MDLTGMDTTSTLGPGAILSGLLGSGGGGAGGASPYTLPLTLLLSLLPALFGQNRGLRDMKDLIAYLKPGQPMYMSPNLPAMDKTALNAVLNQYGRTQNWGWPQGTR